MVQLLEQIKKDLLDHDFFNQKNKWRLIQDYLRNFRNYEPKADCFKDWDKLICIVHIQKECEEEEIDDDWYKVMKPMFRSILNSFKSDLN